MSGIVKNVSSHLLPTHIFSRGKFALIFIAILLIIDQSIKIAVKTNMTLHESIEVTPWFFINFIENSGMAYGMTFINKLVLSLFRVAVSGVLAYYIWLQVRQKARWGYVALLSMLLAGAAGNIFDSMFYGLVFTESTPFAVSAWVDFGNGYAPFLKGRVVDMFYFPLIETDLPTWLPIWGGDHYIFFSPVFNFADACISVSMVLLLLFFRKELSVITLKKPEQESEKSDMPLASGNQIQTDNHKSSTM